MARRAETRRLCFAALARSHPVRPPEGYTVWIPSLERARAAGNPTPELLAELSQALWATGQRVLGLQRIAEGVALAPQSAEMHYVYGLMLAEMGRRTNATAELQQAATLGRATPVAERAQLRLQELSHAHSPTRGASD